MKRYITAIKNYNNFSGKSSRTEFWLFYLFHNIITGMFMLIDSNFFKSNGNMFAFGITTIVYHIFIFIPILAIYCRRLNDAGLSKWFLLLNLIPILGNLWFLIILTVETENDTSNIKGNFFN